MLGSYCSKPGNCGQDEWKRKWKQPTQWSSSNSGKDNIERLKWVHSSMLFVDARSTLQIPHHRDTNTCQNRARELVLYHSRCQCISVNRLTLQRGQQRTLSTALCCHACYLKNTRLLSFILISILIILTWNLSIVYTSREHQLCFSLHRTQWPFLKLKSDHHQNQQYQKPSLCISRL